ncbi:MAG: zf-HC2 domain-containing protein [Deltaproteobacteria bacterium]|nr:zf-HC2 domain-containing protein [Deltaproteobacteria bacterium]
MDGELPERKSRLVERHLAGCPTCLSKFDGLRGLAPLLEKDELPPVPAGLSARILAEAAFRQKHKEAQKTSGWEWLGFLFQPWLVRGATTAALIVGLAMGALMGWTSYPRPDSAQWMTTNENVARNMYAFDVLGAEPRGSIEAATLALLDDGR